MKTAAVLVFLSLALTACQESPNVEITQPSPVKSGYDFLTPETQSLQNDSFENPAFLWVETGEALFSAKPEVAPACASCHTDDALVGVAATYPKIDPRSGDLVNLEGRINLCREQHQNLTSLPYESRDLLALTSYVANQSIGQPINVSVQGDAQKHLKRGRSYFFTRRGQLNLSCHQCHDQNWGKQLRGDTISQGHGTGFPAYRFEWEAVGSLHRRLSDCDLGVRAEPMPLGSRTYIDLELYLAARAQGLDIETPAVRR